MATKTRDGLTGGDVNTIDIAELLEDSSLTDSAILSREGWESRVRPKTRPLLEAIAATVRLGKASYYQADGDNADVRECFDNLHWDPRDRLRLSVRLGRLLDSADTNFLYWGVFGWARKDKEFHGFMDRLRSVEKRVPGYRITEAPVAGVGGRYLMLVKSLDPAALREREPADLMVEIKSDLEALSRNLF